MFQTFYTYIYIYLQTKKIYIYVGYKHSLKIQ